VAGYDDVLNTIQQNGLSWNEIDRILLNPDTYAEMQSRASFDIADHYTSNNPAVRETDGEEKLVYVSKTGVELEVSI
jgi:hypothetical protein